MIKIILLLAANAFAGGGTVTGGVGVGATVDLTTEITGTLPVANGGSGATTLTDGGVLFGNGTAAIGATGVLTNGQLLIGDGTEEPATATLTGTASQLTVTNAAGAITLSIAQNIAATSSPTFANATLTYGINAATATFTGSVFQVGSGGTPLAIISTGSYNPIVTLVTNIASTATATAIFIRIGNIVQVAGNYTASLTTGNTSSRVGVSLPIASDLTATSDLGGVGSNTLGDPQLIYGDTSADRADTFWTPAATTNATYSFQFLYTIR